MKAHYILIITTVLLVSQCTQGLPRPNRQRLFSIRLSDPDTSSSIESDVNTDESSQTESSQYEDSSEYSIFNDPEYMEWLNSNNERMKQLQQDDSEETEDSSMDESETESEEAKSDSSDDSERYDRDSSEYWYSTEDYDDSYNSDSDSEYSYSSETDSDSESDSEYSYTGSSETDYDSYSDYDYYDDSSDSDRIEDSYDEYEDDSLDTRDETRGHSRTLPVDTRGRSRRLPVDTRVRSRPLLVETRGRSHPLPVDTRGRSRLIPVDTRASRVQNTTQRGPFGHRHRHRHMSHRHRVNPQRWNLFTLRHSNAKDLWLPGRQSVREWKKCHGMNQNEYEATLDRIRRIKELADEDVGTHSRMDNNDLNFNKDEDGTLDGCIWLTYEQADTIYKMALQHHQKISKTRLKRKIIDLVQNPWNKWDVSKPIYYKFDGAHNADQQDIIRGAISHWEQNSCITFKEATADQVIIENHIIFTDLGRCQSYVGKVTVNPQPISLAAGCLYEFGVPVHEIGHALGFWHEQQRVDRDDHIIINWNNLGSYRSQFYTATTTTHGVPYDINSIMHYATYDGSTNSLKVIETRDPLYQQSPGQRTSLSFLDKKLIHKAYCEASCGFRKTKQPCKNGGFQNVHKCSECVCPDGLGGKYCETVAPSVNAVCGGEFYAINQQQFIYSPGYTTDGYYQPQQECSWLIKARPGEEVQLEFVDDFGVYFHQMETCFHWVEVRYDGNIANNGPRMCGNLGTPDIKLTSTGGEMLVIFKSNYTVQWNSYMRGFKAKITAVSNSIVPITHPTTTTSTTTTSTTTTTTTTAPPAWSWSCDFDSTTGRYAYDWCNMKQEEKDDVFDWIIKSGRTPSYKTGPEGAYSGRYYIYTEASSPRKYEDNAIIYLPELSGFSGYTVCIHFRYYMYGFHVNRLELFVQPERRKRVPVWVKYGEQDQTWLPAKVQVTLKNTDKIGFNAVRGKEFSGDIALEDIEVIAGTCNKV